MTSELVAAPLPPPDADVESVCGKDDDVTIGIDADATRGDAEREYTDADRVWFLSDGTDEEDDVVVAVEAAATAGVDDAKDEDGATEARMNSNWWNTERMASTGFEMESVSDANDNRGDPEPSRVGDESGEEHCAARHPPCIVVDVVRRVRGGGAYVYRYVENSGVQRTALLQKMVAEFLHGCVGHRAQTSSRATLMPG